MKLNQWTIFIDMLGYGALNNKINNIEKANKLLEFMDTNVKIFQSQDNDYIKQTYSEKEFDLYRFYDIQVALISDSLIINYFPKEIDDIPELKRNLHSANTLFIIIKRLQTFIFHCMVEHNIFVRGGISDKFCLIKGNFAVGEGLIEAYQIESQIARNPRICLSSSIMGNRILIDNFNLLTKTLYKKDSFLKLDEDKQYFIDYLLHNITEPEQSRLQKTTKHKFFETHKKTIEYHLETIKEKITLANDENVLNSLNKNLKKYKWLKNYHNSVLKDYKENKYLIN